MLSSSLEDLVEMDLFLYTLGDIPLTSVPHRLMVSGWDLCHMVSPPLGTFLEKLVEMGQLLEGLLQEC